MPDTGVPERIKKLRLYMRMTGPQMAEHIGISYPRWNNFERGYPVPVKVAILICTKCPGVTLDWLYLGRTSLMDHGLAMNISRQRTKERHA